MWYVVWLGDFFALKFYWFWVSRNFQKPPGAAFMPPGTTDFPILRSFHKTAFPDSLTVRFRWNFGRLFTTCSLLWTVEIWIRCMQREIYVTHDWLFEFPNSMITNGWLSVLKWWYGLDWWMYIYKHKDVWLMSMFVVVLVETCWIYEPIYVSSNVWCYKCTNKATIDDITMIEWCMITTGFGKVWEHYNHTLKVVEWRGVMFICVVCTVTYYFLKYRNYVHVFVVLAWRTKSNRGLGCAWWWDAWWAWNCVVPDGC